MQIYIYKHLIKVLNYKNNYKNIHYLFYYLYFIIINMHMYKKYIVCETSSDQTLCHDRCLKIKAIITYLL